MLALNVSATMTQILLRDRPKVVQLSIADEGYFGLALQKWQVLPFVIYAHGNEVLRAMRSEWPKPRMALQKANRVFAASRWTANLLESEGIDPSRIEIVHPGCDMERFSPGNLDARSRKEVLGRYAHSRVLLTVGWLVKRKVHDVTIRALGSVPGQHP